MLDQSTLFSDPIKKRHMFCDKNVTEERLSCIDYVTKITYLYWWVLSRTIPQTIDPAIPQTTISKPIRPASSSASWNKDVKS